MPDWFTLEPLEDGSYVAMDDPMVKEMLAIFAERCGNMGCRVFKKEHQIEKAFGQKSITSEEIVLFCELT